MRIADPFSYTARWHGAGLDCCFCKHFRGPAKWPDTNRVSWCQNHEMSLAIELRADGYKEGEWFCRDFLTNGEAFAKAIREFRSVESQLAPNILYAAHGEGGFLQELTFEEVRRHASQQCAPSDRSHPVGSSGA